MDSFWKTFGVDGASMPANLAFAANNNDIPGGVQMNVVEDNSIDPPAFHSPPVEPTPQYGKRVARREKNFNHQEDELICSAWANVSKDPVIGINQPSGAYWKRFYDYFHANKTFESERTLIAIQRRWFAIQKATSKFCGYVQQMERRNESGKGDTDRTNNAMKLYNELEGHPFRFIHCWMLLKKEWKWCDYLLGNTGGTQEPPGGTSSEAQSAGSTEPVALNSVGDGSDPLSRPLGREAAKKRRAKGSMASSSSSPAVDVLEKMTDTRASEYLKREVRAAEYLAREDKKLQLKEREISARERQAMAHERHTLALERAEEARIMSIDVDKVPEWQREYYMSLQREIVNKRRNMSLS